jgi:hypothetical protein
MNTSLKNWKSTFIYLFIYLLGLKELHTLKTNELPLPTTKIPNQMIVYGFFFQSSLGFALELIQSLQKQFFVIYWSFKKC